MSRGKKRNKNYYNKKKNLQELGIDGNYKDEYPATYYKNNIIDPNNIKIKPRTKNQSTFLKALKDVDTHIVLGTGPAGTGKTYVATKYAIEALLQRDIEKIVITRPAVSVNEQHGFLPGSLTEKMEPWILPILDVFYEHFTKVKIAEMINAGIIDISPLAYMRGRTFKNSIILADEMQNAVPDQIKMILTRIGSGSKIVMTGDLEQHDRGFEKNGLKDFVNRMKHKDTQMIELIEFERHDIRRHPVINDVLCIYDEMDADEGI